VTLLGPATLRELAREIACVPLALTQPLVAPHVKGTITPPARVVVSEGLDGALRWCHQAILDGQAKATITCAAAITFESVSGCG
jgi:hypothetical protein